MSELVGQRLQHYEILEELGSGGMGVVYRARDLNLRREVALKVLDAKAAVGEEIEQRFGREARALATITHPNIVTVHEFGSEAGLHYFAMELIEGSSLEEVLEERRRNEKPLFDDHELLQLALPLADAVSAAHDRGVIHRDLKPGNIMLTSDGRLKVLDFGVAKLVRGGLGKGLSGNTLTTQVGLLLGTVPYMCPEAIEDGVVDARSDIFSLGVILFELASQQRPFTGASPMAVLSSILRDSPPSLAELAPSLSPRLIKVIGRCLAKDPAERYQSASELHFDLDTLRRRLDSQEVLLANPRPWRLYRRKRRIWAALVAGTLGLAGLGYWGVDRLLEPRPDVESSPAVAVDQDLLRRPRVVVRAFRSVGEPVDPYFAEGIADEISSRLSAIRSFGVVSRGEHFDDDEALELADIRRVLDVDYLLEGTVHWSRDGGRQVRVIPRLIDLSDETQVWSEPFSSGLENIFDVQGQVALSVVSALELGLLKEERAQLEKAPTQDSQAYLSYLRGRYFWRQRGSGLRRGLEYFEEASRLDPTFALAHLGVADVYSLLAVFGSSSSQEALGRARQAVDRAIALDPTLAEAYATAGFIELLESRDWAAAEDDFRLSIELNPNYAEGRRWWALYLVCRGRFDEAVEQAGRAIELDPLSPQAIGNMALVLNYAGRYSQAIEHTERYLELHNDYPVAYWLLGLAHVRGGSTTRGLEALDRAIELARQPLYRAYKGIGLAAAERPDEAVRVAESLIEERGRRYIRPYPLAMIYAEAGDRQRALSWLEVALEENDVGLMFLGIEKSFDRLRTDAEFVRLMARAGFAAEARP